MKRWAWIIVIVLLVLYVIIVGNWWLEGNRNEQRYMQQNSVK